MTTQQSLQKNILLAPLTTFKIGGPASNYVTVTSLDELQDALHYAHEHALPWFIIAGGSNVLVSDAGFSGLIIHNKIHQREINGTNIVIGTGEVLLDVLHFSAEHGLGGWEKLGGIPGTIGGALRGNAGAFGSEIKDFVMSVTAYNSETKSIEVFTKEACEFAYRHSYFKKNPQYVLVSCEVQLSKVVREDSEKVILETIAERERRHLQNVACAGSFFTNPVAPQGVQEMFSTEKNAIPKEGRVPAGWLIEKVGLKGYRVGAALSSLMHTNYIMNDGGATASDVRAVSAKIKDAVKKEFGIELVEEVSHLGF